MKITSELLNSEEHCLITHNSVELILHRKGGCTMCAAFGQSIRTPDVVVGNVLIYVKRC